MAQGLDPCPPSIFANTIKDSMHCFKDCHCVAVDGSVVEEKSDIGIVSSQLAFSYSTRLPNYTFISKTELTDIILALQNFPSVWTKVLPSFQTV